MLSPMPSPTHPQSPTDATPTPARRTQRPPQQTTPCAEPGTPSRGRLPFYALLLALVLLLPATRPAQAQDSPATVSFPGSYVSALGGTDWEPSDPFVQATDSEGDGVWTLVVSLPPGDYEFKVAVGGSWDENYGLDGEAGGANIPFSVPEGPSGATSEVTFTYDRTSGAISAAVGPPTAAPEVPAARGDGQFVAGAVLHDSRSDRYRTPFGAQPVGTDVTLRLRTAANDVEGVTLVANDLSAGSPSSRAMEKVISDGQYDWWQATLTTGPGVTVHNYHFALSDGGATAFYADDSSRNGGPGEFSTAAPASDSGWDIYAYAPDFTTPAWAQNATIYQVFPDRFRNGDASNDPTAEDWFYPEERGQAFPVTPWNRPVPDPVPEDPAANPEWYGTFSSTFYGGDLQGVAEKLDYLQELGVTAIYFNPIFDSPSNHRYDGRDYRQVDDNLAVGGDLEASNALFRELAAEAEARGMHVILDGVPNHTSSDSPFFDRYGRHDLEGACESEESPYRDWYIFTPARPEGSGVCAGDTNYAAWAGYATLPQVDTANEEVIEEWLGPDGIIATWLQTPGVDGWRIDVVPDVVLVNPAFFELLRTAAKSANPDALLISETWQERDARQRVLGDEFDTSMNYRFRAAVLGFLRDSEFSDNDGAIAPLTPTEFDAALRAVQEDYPPGAFAAAMNLISSHDVNRAVNVLDHAGINAERSAPLDGFADARRRLALAAALQFTLPGAPTVYYGDEVGLAGFGSDPQRDDPYNRQPYPWADAEGYADLPTWRQADEDLLALYQQLGALRGEHSFLRTGTWDTLALDDATGLYIYGRKDDSGAAIVAFNRGSQPITTSLDLVGYIPTGASLAEVPSNAPAAQSAATEPTTEPATEPTTEPATESATESAIEPATLNEDGSLEIVIPPLDFRIWVTGDDVDMRTPAPPAVTVAEGNRELRLFIADSTPGDALPAVEFAVLRSLVDGGYEEVGRFLVRPDTVFTDPGVVNGTPFYYRTVAIGANGLRSAPTDTGPLVAHAPIESITIDEPLVIQHTLSAVEPSPESRAAVQVPGITDLPGPGAGLRAQIGWAPAGSEEFTWADATYVNDNQGGANIYAGRMLPESAGDYDFAWRATTTSGREWTLGDGRGKLTVYPAADAEAPKPPFRLDPLARSGSQLSFAWRVSRPQDLYNFRICRTELSSGGDPADVPAEQGTESSGGEPVAEPTTGAAAPASEATGEQTGVPAAVDCPVRFDVPRETNVFTDTTVTAGSTYVYTVQVVDESFNVSTPSQPLTMTAELSIVDVTWRVLVPAATPPDDLVFIAGDDGAVFGASFNPSLQPMQGAGENLWEFTARVEEGTRLQYKYTRGSWETVEQWGSISGMANRQLQIVAGPDNTMLVDDTATDWGAEGSDDRRAVQAWRDPLVATVTPPPDSSGPVEDVRAEFTILVTAADPNAVITVTGPDGEEVAGATVLEGGRTAVWTPSAPLPPGAYTATVFNVEQTTPMVTPYQWEFTVP